MNSENYRKYLFSHYSPASDFIEKFLPDYFTNENVAEIDRLWRYIGNEELDPRDEKLYKEQFPDKRKAAEELVEVEGKLFKRCLSIFYAKYFAKELNDDEN